MRGFLGPVGRRWRHAGIAKLLAHNERQHEANTSDTNPAFDASSSLALPGLFAF